MKDSYPKVIKISDILGILKSKYHGRNREGNQCRKILNNIKKLKIPDHLNEYRTVLSNLRNLLFLCNSDYLPHNYIEVLYKFFSSWFKLRNRFNISTTPKINIILHHLEDYFDDAELTLKQCTEEFINLCIKE